MRGRKGVEGRPVLAANLNQFGAARAGPMDTPRIGKDHGVHVLDLRRNNIAIMVFGWNSTWSEALDPYGMPGCALQVSLDIAFFRVLLRRPERLGQGPPADPRRSDPRRPPLLPPGPGGGWAGDWECRRYAACKGRYAYGTSKCHGRD